MYRVARLRSAARGFATAASRGNLMVWGKSEHGCLGMKVEGLSLGDAIVGSTVSVPIVNTNIFDRVKHVTTRATKTLAVLEDGTLLSWGKCDNFSLGHGPNVTTTLRPKRVEALSGIKITTVAAGETASACISDEGDLYTWGWGGSFWQGNGGLGHGDDVTQPQPALVEAFSNANVRLAQVSVGSAHMVALDTNGKVWAWGNGEYGRCGNGKRKQKTPELVELLADKKCVSVSAGAQFSVAVTDQGEVYAWGKNDAAQLGLGGNMVMDVNTMEDYPCLVEASDKEAGGEGGGDDAAAAKGFTRQVVHVAAGNNHCVALTRDGSVYQWGKRTFLSPHRVETGYFRAPGSKKEVATPAKAVAVAAGDGVSALVDVKGDLYTWGKNLFNGVLGHGSKGVGSRVPVRVEALAGCGVGEVTIGSTHAAAIVTRLPAPVTNVSAPEQA